MFPTTIVTYLPLMNLGNNLDHQGHINIPEITKQEMNQSLIIITIIIIMIIIIFVKMTNRHLHITYHAHVILLTNRSLCMKRVWCILIKTNKALCRQPLLVINNDVSCLLPKKKRQQAFETQKSKRLGDHTKCSAHDGSISLEQPVIGVGPCLCDFFSIQTSVCVWPTYTSKF